MPLSDANAWPDLPYAAWKDTRETLHLWTQIVGKIRSHLGRRWYAGAPGPRN